MTTPRRPGILRLQKLRTCTFWSTPTYLVYSPGSVWTDIEEISLEELLLLAIADEENGPVIDFLLPEFREAENERFAHQDNHLPSLLSTGPIADEQVFIVDPSQPTPPIGIVPIGVDEILEEVAIAESPGHDKLDFNGIHDPTHFVASHPSDHVPAEHQGYMTITTPQFEWNTLASENHLSSNDPESRPGSSDLREDDVETSNAGENPDTVRKADAVFFMLTRNSDLKGVLSTIRQVEDRFNKKFRYPYVFLNDYPFEERFKSLVAQLTDAPIQFGLIAGDQWNQPSWIDEEKATIARQEMAAKGSQIPYADSISYRNMCRFNSGFFYRHELLKPFKYYWRIEPDVDFFCDLDYDPFLYMQDNAKVYGFTIALHEFWQTIPTLWGTVKEFMEANPELISPDNSMNFVSDDGGLSYNQCHFWSNFEIGDLDFWRGEAYSRFFDALDQKGGFYYERWGDAPVHSIAAALFAKKDQIHFFDDIGYRHNPIQHCPQGDTHKKKSCWCDPMENYGKLMIQTYFYY